MELLKTVLLMAIGFAAYALATFLYVRWKERHPKKKTPWLTANQIAALDVIRQHGRGGLPLWHTDINLATIRSLAKHGFCDTASRGRILITRAGRKRLLKAWPPEQPTGDQKNRADASGSADEEGELTGSQEASEYAD